MRRSETGYAEQKDRSYENGFSAEAVGKWTGAECAPRKSKQGGTKNRGQRRLRQPPFGDKRRRDVADSGRIKSIQEDDEKTQCKNEPLKARKSMRVQKFLDVNPPLNSHISTLPILIVTGTSVSPHGSVREPNVVFGESRLSCLGAE